jgi:hypothetical protein
MAKYENQKAKYRQTKSCGHLENCVEEVALSHTHSSNTTRTLQLEIPEAQFCHRFRRINTVGMELLKGALLFFTIKVKIDVIYVGII